ncbi:hypothetical protein RP20_CCG024185 [Aedes albopictus]|nr:hypothetical protein RP20_CCG024185 [Aedes albopictus]
MCVFVYVFDSDDRREVSLDCGSIECVDSLRKTTSQKLIDSVQEVQNQRGP